MSYDVLTDRGNSGMCFGTPEQRVQRIERYAGMGMAGVDKPYDAIRAALVEAFEAQPNPNDEDAIDVDAGAEYDAENDDETDNGPTVDDLQKENEQLRAELEAIRADLATRPAAPTNVVPIRRAKKPAVVAPDLFALFEKTDDA